MSLLVGAAVVLASWGVLLLLILGWGLPLALTVSKSVDASTLVRRALWLGLAIGSALTLVMSLLIPLTSLAASVTLLTTSLAGGFIGFRLWRRRKVRTVTVPRGPVLLLVGGLVLAQVVLAFAVLGPVTNYDTGLYHLGAITYGSDYGIVPGLSNLYGPLGYATLEFAWGSVLSVSPLADNGFRLLNGLLMLVVSVELLLRLVNRTRVGNYFLLVSVIAMWGPMLGMADFWIASPTQDAAALMLTLAMTAYFLDALRGRRGGAIDAWIAILIGVLLVAVRTTMVGYVALVCVALGGVAIRRRYRLSGRPGPPLLVGSLAAVIGGTMLIRDYLLSGWLLYPLSFLPLDVPWRAENPQGLRDATLGFHRNRKDIAGSLDGWNWIPGWFARLTGYWETYLTILLVIMLIVSIVMCRTRRVSLPVKAILVTTTPAVGAVTVWFVLNPPTFRFVWGPLVALFSIPIAWMWWSLDERSKSHSSHRDRNWRLLIVGGTVVLFSASVLTPTVRIPWDKYTESVTIAGLLTYRVAPITAVATNPDRLPSGLEVLRPTRTDQCWGVFPLCTPNPAPTLQLRGATLDEGFLR